MRKALWLVLSVLDICRTVELVETPGERSCTCSARSAGALNFYWRIPVQPGHIYHCEMNSGFHMQVLQDKCTVPEGVELSWEACCGFTPAIVNVDTHDMQPAEGDAVIKFQVAPSDIPSDVHITCDFADEEA